MGCAGKLVLSWGSAVGGSAADSEIFAAPGRPTTVLLTNIVRFGGTRQITAAQRAAFRPTYGTGTPR
jgi:hypothetical protein